MTLDERLRQVAVLGAGGKMGSGISFLLAREMTLMGMKTNQPLKLILMDVVPEALEGVRRYLGNQARKFALKNVARFKEIYGPVPDPEALADQFARDMESILKTTTDLKEVGNALLVFEAIIENISVKVNVFSRLRKICSAQTFFLSNTSSIPIRLLDEQAELQGRIIGFHFYNPPAVQKLVELIIPQKVQKDLPEMARELGLRLEKKLIPSSDVAGFIGNGHFVRDGLYAISEVQRLKEEMTTIQAIYVMNRITQEFLVRPMGIFQLIDYVGIDVFQSILQIMNPYFPDEDLHSPLIDEMVNRGIRGGQYPDGTQKDGFLHYEAGKPAGIYNLETSQYVSYDDGDWKCTADDKIGDLPRQDYPWKILVKDPERERKLHAHFMDLKTSETLGAGLALKYLKRSKEIGEKLLNEGVARSEADVNGVLKYGFYHLYGPINDYV